MTLLKRRQFIIGCFAAAGALGVALAKKRWAPPEGFRRLAAPEMLTRFLDERAIVKLGDSYRRARPSESDTADLTVLLFGNDGLKAPVKSWNDEKRMGFLEEKARDDFAGGRLVQVDGWLMSQTEARQCALFSSLPDE